MKKRFLFLMAAILFLAGGAGAQGISDRRNPQRLLKDYAHVFSPQQAARIEQRLNAFADTTSTQVLVVTATDLGGTDISEAATELGHRWGVGQKGKDNGVVILIKPKTGGEAGEVFIAVGYGLEGIIPDAVAKMIVDEEMLPAFRNGDMYGGVTAALDAVFGLASKEFTADQYARKHGNVFYDFLSVFFILLIVFLLIPRKRKMTVDGESAHGSILPWILLGGLGSRRGGFDDFSNGSGGFGGFGGGGFGGGGAGGRW